MVRTGSSGELFGLRKISGFSLAVVEALAPLDVGWTFRDGVSVPTAKLKQSWTV